MFGAPLPFHKPLARRNAGTNWSGQDDGWVRQSRAQPPYTSHLKPSGDTWEGPRMTDSTASDRHQRRHTRTATPQSRAALLDDGRSPGRHDRDRVLYSEAFQRLVDVTQVVTPNNNGRITTNRLTHSLKVAQVARSIGEHLLRLYGADELEPLGGLDPDVVEAAALAHDLGHPPFGHIGEKALDGLALDAGLREGFEGNAQSFRIVTRLEAKSTRYVGLNLTAASRAAILKYPWSRPHPPLWPPAVQLDGRVRCDHEAIKAACKADATFKLHWKKFGVYEADRTDFDQARALHPEPDSGRQSLEGSVMDIADDITYALHDLEDFYQAGLFDGPRAAAELKAWQDVWSAQPEDSRAKASVEVPGGTFARLWAELRRDYPDLLDNGHYDAAVRGAHAFIAGTVYAEAFRGSFQQVAQLRSQTSEKISDFLKAIVVEPTSPAPAPWVALEPAAWHLVQVLKRLTRSFIIDRSDVALSQIGQQRVIVELADALFEWAHNDPDRLPVRLREGLSAQGVVDSDDSQRPVIDFLASLTDHQAYQLHAALRGSVAVPLTSSFVL